MYPILLTFDLEYWFESLSIQKHLIGNETDNLSVFVERILALLAENNANATFFVSGKVLDKESEIIKKVSQAGHEIAAHSLDHKPLEHKNAEAFDIEIKEMSNKLEKLTGQQPIGHRAVNFSLNKKTSWAIQVLINNGFKYDSSILLYGLKPNFYKVNNLTEFSVFSGGIYMRLIPWFIFKAILKNRLNQKPTCLYFHPFDFFDKAPKIKMPLFKKFIKYYNTRRTWRKLEYIVRNFKCISIKEHLNNSCRNDYVLLSPFDKLKVTLKSHGILSPDVRRGRDDIRFL